MNNYKDIIVAPIITEKAESGKNDNKYTFKIAYNANKIQIKQAIEKIFNVKVKSVNTINVKPKPKTVGKYSGYTRKYKKAIVTLVKDNTIDFE